MGAGFEVYFKRSLGGPPRIVPNGKRAAPATNAAASAACVYSSISRGCGHPFQRHPETVE